MRHPIGSKVRGKKRSMAAFTGVAKGLKNYGKSVVGGAKIVGGAIKKAVQWPGKQIEKEIKANRAKDDEYRRQGENLMQGREEYNPLTAKKKAEAMLKRGMRGERK